MDEKKHLFTVTAELDYLPDTEIPCTPGTASDLIKPGWD
jgi:hypothetical protein